MDSDSDKKEEISDPISNFSDIFQSFGVRRSVCACDEMDKIISNNRYYFLLHFNIIFLLVLALFAKK